MTVKQILDDALKTPMNRKEFLGQLGALLLGVIGITSMLHALSGHKYTTGGTADTFGAYGTSAYGDSRKV